MAGLDSKEAKQREHEYRFTVFRIAFHELVLFNAREKKNTPSFGKILLQTTPLIQSCIRDFVRPKTLQENKKYVNHESKFPVALL